MFATNNPYNNQQYTPQSSSPSPHPGSGAVSPQPISSVNSSIFQQQTQPFLPPRPAHRAALQPPTSGVPPAQRVQVKFQPASSAKPSSTTATYEKVRLATNRADLQLYERRADLYAILISIDHLESAYLRDYISSTEYAVQCNRFLSQYKTWMDAHGDTIQHNLDLFLHTSGLNCPAAVNRIKSGVPATTIHGGGDINVSSTLSAVDIVEKYVSTLDVVRLNTNAIDELFPYLDGLLEDLLKYPNLPPDAECKEKIIHWVRLCKAMKATDSLDDEQTRQLAFDLEYSYNSFRKFVASTK